MNNGTRAALVTASIVFAHAAPVQAAHDPNASAPRPIDVAVASRSIAGAPVADRERSEATTVDERTQSTMVATKRDSASLPGSDAFVLLGMCVVLLGVVARQKRGFRRSGTILLR